MKPHLPSAGLGFAVLALLAGCAPRADKTTQTADVPAVETATEAGRAALYLVMGDVRKQPSGGAWAGAARGVDLVAGNAIATGADGNALLVFSNGARLLLRPNSELVLTQFNYAPFDQAARGTFLHLKGDPSKSIIRLELRRGSILGDAQVMYDAGGPALKAGNRGGSMFTVQTPAGGVAVLGGYFALETRGSAPDGGPSSVTASSATGAGLRLASLDGREASIPAGTEMEASVTTAPGLRGRSVIFTDLRCLGARGVEITEGLTNAVNDGIARIMSTPGTPLPFLVPPTPAPCPLK